MKLPKITISYGKTRGALTRALSVFFIVSLAFGPVPTNTLFSDWGVGASVAQAAFNPQINYQGKLTNSSNVAVPDGAYNIEFKLYTVPTGGSPIWTETWCLGAACSGTGTDNRIQVASGLFSTLLGSTTDFTGVDFNQTLYLGVNIGGTGSTPTWDGEMSPRKKLGAVPAAFVAQSAAQLNGLDSTQFLRSDVANSTSTSSTFVTLSQAGAGDALVVTGQSSAPVLNVQSGGNIGVGTTSPYARFSIAGAAGTASDIFAISTSTSGFATATAFRVAANGKTHIGNNYLTAQGTGALNIYNSAAPNQNAISYITGNTTQFSVKDFGYVTVRTNDTTYGASLNINTALDSVKGIVVRANSGTQTANLQEWQDSNGAVLGQVGANGYLGLGTTTPFAKLSVHALATETNTSLFAVASSTATATSTLFVVNNSGNVGLGTANPNFKFQIGNTVATVYGNTVYDNVTFDSGLAYSAWRTASVETFMGADNGGGNGDFGVASNHPLRIYTNNAIRVTVSAAGLFGIGTTTPGANLAVQGNGLFSGNLSVAGLNATGTVRISNLTGPLQAIAGVVSATSTLSPIYGGTGVSTLPTYGQLLVGNSTGGYTLTATSSLGITSANVGSGTQGQVPFYNAVGSTITATSSLFIAQSGNIGIGTTSPYAKLSVAGETVAALFTATTTTATSTFSTGFVVGTTTAASFMVDRFTGYVGIGTSTALDKLQVAGDIRVGLNTTGCVKDADGTVIGGTCSSDIRLKKNIAPIGEVLDKVANLDVVHYDWRSDEFPQYHFGGERQLGVIAQNVEEQFPELIATDQYGYKQVNHSALPLLAIQAVKDFVNVIDVRNATSVSPSLTVTADGKIGIGTTSPNYKLHVMGDAAATAFVNISTKDSKKDIAYVTSGEKDDMMTKLRSLKLARYHYKQESDSNPMRIGLIAEDSPAEVLSVDGKGVDLYKLSSLVLAGLQIQDERLSLVERKVADMQTQIAALQGVASTTVSIDPTTISLTSASIDSYLNTLGIRMTTTLAQFKSVVADTFTAKQVKVEEGITIKDRANGNYYCVTMENGEMKSLSGDCAAVLTGSGSNQAAQVPVPAPQTTETSSTTPVTPPQDGIGDESASNVSTTTVATSTTPEEITTIAELIPEIATTTAATSTNP